MSGFERRLRTLEVMERRAEIARLDAWAVSLSYDELEALIGECRRKHPDDMALLEAMSVAELDAEIERRVNEGVL